MYLFKRTGRNNWLIQLFKKHPSFDKAILFALTLRELDHPFVVVLKGEALTLKWISLKCDDNPPLAWRTDLSWLHRGEHWWDGFSSRSMRTSTRLLANQQNVLRDFRSIYREVTMAREVWNATRAIGLGYAKLFASTWLDLRLHFQMQLG